jgi:hypothetical protein
VSIVDIIIENEEEVLRDPPDEDGWNDDDQRTILIHQYGAS